MEIITLYNFSSTLLRDRHFVYIDIVKFYQLKKNKRDKYI